MRCRRIAAAVASPRRRCQNTVIRVRDAMMPPPCRRRYAYAAEPPYCAAAEFARFTLLLPPLILRLLCRQYAAAIAASDAVSFHAAALRAFFAVDAAFRHTRPAAAAVYVFRRVSSAFAAIFAADISPFSPPSFHFPTPCRHAASVTAPPSPDAAATFAPLPLRRFYYAAFFSAASAATRDAPFSLIDAAVYSDARRCPRRIADADAARVDAATVSDYFAARRV